MMKFLANESVDFRIITKLWEESYEVEVILEIEPGVPMRYCSVLPMK